jgi:hypothetical protein
MYPRAIGLLPEPVNDLQLPPCQRLYHAIQPRQRRCDRWVCRQMSLSPCRLFLEALFASRDSTLGLAAKEFMRYAYPRFVRSLPVPGEFLRPDSRVTLDTNVRDRYGLPVARLSGTIASRIRANIGFHVRARSRMGRSRWCDPFVGQATTA